MLLTCLLKGSVRDIQHSLLSSVVCYWRSWVQIFCFFSLFYNTFNLHSTLCYECRYSIKKPPSLVGYDPGIFWSANLCDCFLYLTVSISGKVISLAILSCNSLSWLIFFFFSFPNLLAKIQCFHHFSLFPSGGLTPAL